MKDNYARSKIRFITIWLRHNKFELFIGSNTNRGYDVSTNALKRSVVNIGKSCYMKNEVIIEGSTVHALALFHFPANRSTISDVF